VDAGSVTVDAELERDWASSSGGATIDPDSVVGPDFGEPCAPVNAIDQSDVFGWSTTSDLLANGTAGPDTPKSFVVKLPQAIDISRVEVNPTAICGDGASASTGEFSIRVSADGTNWSAPTSGSFVFDDLGSSHEVPLTAGGTNVQYVEYTMEAPIVVTDLAHYAPGDCPGGGFSGCDYMDVTELRVYGS